jgi:hypothetical protein
MSLRRQFVLSGPPTRALFARGGENPAGEISSELRENSNLKRNEVSGLKSGCDT